GGEVAMRLVYVLCGALGGAVVLASCGTDNGPDASATGNGGGNDDGGGGILGNPDGASGVGASVDASFGCDGCAPFPGSNAPPCDPSVLGPPTLAYPLEGQLLPPNMNVLEVQFVPPAGATLFEVDFSNGITNVRVETQCNAVPDVRGGPSKGCGLTLSQQEWTDIANTNRDGDPVKVIVRATKDGSCV